MEKQSVGRLEQQEQKRGARKVRTGVVVSNKMNKTLTVAVDRRSKHRIYGKYVKRTTKLYAHDEQNAAVVGDVVRVMETRPLSKLKRWRLIEIVKK